ncbi:MAG: antibiotic biosynthesis monooxygenase [Sphingobium limneticum]
MMILEHALLAIKPGQSAAFEAVMARARPLIAASPGFSSIAVRKACESPDLYLLIVEWEDIASHRDGFRLSELYDEWRTLLHPFYEPMPAVSYFGEPL